MPQTLRGEIPKGSTSPGRIPNPARQHPDIPRGAGCPLTWEEPGVPRSWLLTSMCSGQAGCEKLKPCTSWSILPAPLSQGIPPVPGSGWDVE